MVGDLASGRSEVEALRRWRDRIRAARHNAMKWHKWQINQGIVPPGPIIPGTAGGDSYPGGPGARLPASADAPPLYRSRPPAKAKGLGGKGVPLARSQTPVKSKGSGGKGRGRGNQSASKGGKKGAHPGRGEYSRYASYSEATSDAVPSIQFQDSVPEGQAKGAPPKGPPSASGRTGVPSDPVPAQEHMPESIRRLSPEAIEEERRAAEAFNAFMDASPTGSRPVVPKPALTAAAGEPPTPTMTYAGPVAPALAPEPKGQAATGAQAETIEPDAGPAPAGEEDEGTATVSSHPPLHQPAAVTVLD